MTTTTLRILITGAHGLIGRALRPYLEAQGHTVKTLSGIAGDAEYSWKRIADVPWGEFDAVIHLAGESIFGRWTSAKKKSIRESRVALTQSLCHRIVRAAELPKVLICASGVGIYGDTGATPANEETPHGRTFLAKLAAEWEGACDAPKKVGVRTVYMRMGTVLSPSGGALAKMLPVFKNGLGGTLGNGKQLQSFVALADVLRAVEFILEHESVDGPVNLVCPQVLSQRDFAKTLAVHLHRPCAMRLPAWILRLVLGQMAQDVLLANACAEPKKLQQAGFKFEFNDLKSALAQMLH